MDELDLAGISYYKYDDIILDHFADVPSGISNFSICVQTPQPNHTPYRHDQADSKNLVDSVVSDNLDTDADDSEGEYSSSDESSVNEDDDSEKPDIIFAVEAILRLNIGPALDLHRERLHQLLRENLKYVLPPTDSSESSRAGTDGTPENKSAGDGPPKPPRKRRSTNSGPRRSNSNDHGNDDDNEEQDGNEQLANSLGSQASIPARKLACPFYKNDPSKYRHWRGCLGPGWDGIARLKAHLYSKHTKPVHCPKCGNIYPTIKERDRHLRQDECENRPELKVDGLDEGQVKAIRSKKRSRDRSDRGKWASIYKIIFPEAEDVPSPYYDTSDSAASRPSPGPNFEEFHLQEMEPILMSVLDQACNNREIVERLTHQFLDLLRQNYPNIAKEFERGQPQGVDPSATDGRIESKSFPPTTLSPTLKSYNTGSLFNSNLNSELPTVQYPSTGHEFGIPPDDTASQIAQRGTLSPVSAESSQSSQSRQLYHPSHSSTSAHFQASISTTLTNETEIQSSGSATDNSNLGQQTFGLQLEALGAVNASHHGGNMYQFSGNDLQHSRGFTLGYDSPAPANQPPLPNFGNVSSSTSNMHLSSYDLYGYEFQQARPNLNWNSQPYHSNDTLGPFSPDPQLGNPNQEKNQRDELGDFHSEQ